MNNEGEIVYKSSKYIKSYFDNADSKNYSKMISLLESIQEIKNIVGRENMKKFMEDLVQDDSIDLAVICAQTYRERKNTESFELYIKQQKKEEQKRIKVKTKEI